MLKRNLLANYIGQGWTGLMSLAFVPLYIKYLGIESYGLIGLFAMLTAWLSLLDMGMTPTLSREMARFTSGMQSAQSIRDLLRTIEVITFGISLVIAAGLALSSRWLATYWLGTNDLPTHVVIQAFAIMGLVAALRFSETIYHSSILGLQRQVLFNVINSSLATLRGLGAVAMLAWVSPSIQTFFLWQGLVSILALGIFAFVTYLYLPSVQGKARFSLQALRSVSRFAGGMLGITFLAVLLTQVDKVLLSKLLSLTDYGYYTLSSTVAAALTMLISPITQAVYPRLCEMHAAGNREMLAHIYHKSAQLISVFAGSAAIVFILFGKSFLELWTHDSILAERTAPLLSLLMLGNFLNGLMWVPYQTQLAYGWTNLAMKVNIFAVILIIPSILLVTPRFGAMGAAWVWVILNLGYLLIASQFMYRRILRAEKWRWYLQDLLAPIGAASCGAFLLKLSWPDVNTPISQLSRLAFAFLVTLVLATLAAKEVRLQLRQLLQSCRTRRTVLDGY
jgi:O-antigen/teichoic acid export membrane protein